MTGGEKSYLQNVSRKCNFQQSEKLDLRSEIFVSYLEPTQNLAWIRACIVYDKLSLN